MDKLEELYKKSLDYIDKEKYADAASILTNMKNYSDTEEKLEFLYNKALNLIGYGKYSDASSILKNLKNYGNSKEKLAELDEKLDKLYNDAVKMSYSNYEEAIKLFEELGNYKDSKDKIEDLKNKMKKKEEDKKNADTYEMKGSTAWVVIDNGYLNVRKTASSDAASVGKLYNGDEITIQATSGNGKWYKVTSGDVTGYCSVDYISTSKPIPDLSGSWIEVGEDAIYMPHFMEITNLLDNYFYVKITYDGDNFTWTFSGEYDSETGLLQYIDGICTTRYGETMNTNTDLSGSLYYSDGHIYWSFPGNGNREFVFERN